MVVVVRIDQSNRMWGEYLTMISQFLQLQPLTTTLTIVEYTIVDRLKACSRIGKP